MPQKKYDLRNQYESPVHRYNKENERIAHLEDVLCAHQKQAEMPKKVKLPTFDCPACHAKNIMFAGDAVAKNETILSLLEENGVADYVIICPKCKQYIGVRRHVGTQVIRRCFRTIGGTPFEYVYVFNHRITRTYQDGEIPMGTRIFYGEINNDLGEKQEEHPVIQCIWLPNSQRPKSRYHLNNTRCFSKTTIK